MKEKSNLLDTAEIRLIDKYGNVKSKHKIPSSFLDKLLIKLGLKHNTIVNVGMAQVAGLILTDISATAFDFVAIGSGTTAAAATNTALEFPVGVRQAGTGTRTTTTVTDDTAQLVATFSQAIDNTLTGTNAITEVGMFTAATAGVMLLRIVYSPADSCNWDAGDTLEVTIKVQIKQGT